MKKVITMLTLLALPAVAHATRPAMQLRAWQTNLPREQCLARMEAAFATQFSNVRRDGQRVFASAGEYTIGGACLNSSASVTVAGPSGTVTGSLYSRFARAWEN